MSGVLFAGFLVIGSGTIAAPPPNDLCGGAFTVPAAGPFPHFSTVVDVIDAGEAGDPPFPSCSSTVLRSVWYSFKPVATADYSLSVSDDTLTTVRDTVMGVYSSSSDCSEPLTELDCNDDENGFRSALFLTLEAATQYYIVVWTFGANSPAVGEGAVQLRVGRLLPPHNDDCALAEIIPAGGPFPHFTAATDVTQATTDADPPEPACRTNLSRSVWYQFTPAVTSTYRISACADTGTTVADTVMGIYVSSGGCAGPFDEVACSDDNCSSRSVVEPVLTAGTTYYVVVWEYGEEPPVPGQTLVQLRISAPPPVFTTPSLLPGGHLQLNFSALAGQSYEIQKSTDLTNWFRLGDAESVSNGVFQFTVTNLVAPARFFRVKSL